MNRHAIVCVHLIGEQLHAHTNYLHKDNRIPARIKCYSN